MASQIDVLEFKILTTKEGLISKFVFLYCDETDMSVKEISNMSMCSKANLLLDIMKEAVREGNLILKKGSSGELYWDENK